jgi:hypothetical protein
MKFQKDLVAFATTSATAATAEFTTTAAAAAAGRTIFTRTGHVDRQGATVNFLAVQAFDGFLGFIGAELMVTKPKPRGRLVMRSIIRLVSVTEPNAANASLRSFSVVLKERFPTNNLLLM